MADEVKVSLSGLSEGTISYDSWFEEAYRGDSFKVSATQIANYVGKTYIFSDLTDGAHTYTIVEAIHLAGFTNNNETSTATHWSSSKVRAEIDKITPRQIVSGNPVRFNTSIVLPMLNCIVGHTVTQTGSGTPSPLNIRPFTPQITSVSLYHMGVNQWNGNKSLGKFNTTTGANLEDNSYYRCVDLVAVKGGIAYRFVFTDNTDGITLMCLDKDQTPIDMTNYQGNYYHDGYCLRLGYGIYDTVVTMPDDCVYIKFFGAASVPSAWLSVNYPASDVDYHTPTSSTLRSNYTLNFDAPHATVIGNLFTGEWVESRKLIFLNDPSSWLEDVNSYYGCNFYYNASLGYGIDTHNSTTSMECSCFKVANSGNDIIRWYLTDGLVLQRPLVNSSLTLAEIRQLASENKIAIMVDMIVSQEYAKFTTEPISLTSINGDNVITTDLDTVSVEYLSSPQEYIDTRVNAITPTVLTGTLIAGQTTITFNDSSITADSMIEPYVDTAFTGVSPTACTASNGVATLTFPAQSSNMPVRIEVK